MPALVQIVGIAAGICTGISMLPQLIKIIKEKNVDDISWFMLVILMAGLGGWVWYGVLKKDYPIIVTNAFSILVNGAILFCRIRFKKK